MPKLLVAYTTYDGHPAEIAERIASALRQSNCAVELCDLARSRPERPIQEYDGVVAGGPLHGGQHPAQLARFVLDNRQALNEQAFAFFSVSLSAAGNEKQQGDATRCLNEFLEKVGWEPTSTSIVAGALLYRKYGFIKRWMMKLIVKRGGGDTDTSRNHVYTDWDAVDQFADEFFAAQLAGRTEAATA